jgi:ankyrin repeat protein
MKGKSFMPLAGIVVLLCAFGFLSLFWFFFFAERRGSYFAAAAARGDFRTARLLLWLGADVNYAAGSGSAMHFAASNGRIDVMEFLYGHGARVDAPFKFGVTPLYMAREANQKEAEAWLLSHGANPDTGRVHPP